MNTKMRKELTEEAKAKLRAIPRTRCEVCNTPISYTNPMERCLVCKKKYCYDHINTKLGKDGIDNYCDMCLKTI